GKLWHGVLPFGVFVNSGKSTEILYRKRHPFLRPSRAVPLIRHHRCIVRLPLALRLWILLSWVALATLAPGAPRVLEMDVDSIVHPVTVEIVSRAFEQAEHQHYDLVLIRLNTPGGLMDAMRETIQKIVASPVPVVTYVAPSGGRAASAGFFLLEAGDVAAMAPGTNTGAAHPVLIGTEMDPIMKQKVQNDAAASLRSLTPKRGRNSDLAQKAVL